MNITNEDNMQLMARYQDNHFDLAIVDPPYGIERFKKGGSIINKHGDETRLWNNEKPTKEYFNELFRVSKNQIIWGGNYFIHYLKATRCMLVWDKGEGFYNRTFAECELAWTSFNKNTKKIKHDPLANGDYKGKIHPTQKPIKLYEWLLNNYSEKGQKILDTHLGSGSIAVACHYFGVDLIGVEIDEEYYNNAKKRVEMLTAQETLF